MNTSSVPLHGGRTLLLGTSLVGGLFAAFFIHLHRRQAHIEEHTPLSVPAWQSRLTQARSPLPLGVREPTHPASANPSVPERQVQHTTTYEHNSGHRTIQSARAEGAEETQRRGQPSPQRAREEGKDGVYTKRDRWWA